jgi:hypothetical protein
MSTRLARLSVFEAALAIIAFADLAQGVEPRVDLEVATEGGFIPTEARAWSEMLTKAGFANVRIKSVTNESPLIETRGTAAAPSYRVVGILTGGNQLLLPKGRFGLSDRGPIEGWLRKLREGGEDAINIKPAAFGLLPKQLVAVHEVLAARVQGATLDKPPREVAKSIADRLTLKFVSDESVQRALATEEPVADELQGLTSGTALAAILRPLGLVMFPEKNSGEIRLRIANLASAKEYWPVGWPPKGNPSETLPELFKQLKVEINNTPLSETLTAIGGRIKAPLLFDRNALARGEIDLDTKVSLPAAGTFYSKALDRLLFQARLKYEIRVDEAGKPFLWITTLKP